MSNIYPFLLAAGVLAALLWIGFYIPGTRSTTPAYNQRGLDAALWAIIAGLTGARLGYVVLHFNYFRANPKQITWFWEGGLSWIGGVAGALLGIALFSLVNKYRFWPLVDIFAIPIPILGFACWFGCLFDNCAYGKRAQVGILTPPTEDIFGLQAHRWPVQGAGAIICLIIFLGLLYLQRREFGEGILFMISLSAISAGNLLLYFFRGDSTRLINGLRLDAITTAVLASIAITILLVLLLKPSSRRKENEV